MNLERTSCKIIFIFAYVSTHNNENIMKESKKKINNSNTNTYKRIHMHKYTNSGAKKKFKLNFFFLLIKSCGDSAQTNLRSHYLRKI